MFDSLKKKTAAIFALSDQIPDVVSARLGFERFAKYMFEQVLEQIDRVERDETVTNRAEALSELRRLGLDDFGLVMWSMPDARFPKLSALLPAMASAEAQRHWTGRSGIGLLKPTVNFVRIAAYNYAKITGSAISSQTRILDYGCGYGRIARLMYYFADEANIWGVDPWEKSISLCNEAGLGRNFRQSQYLPDRLPVSDAPFDLIYAYSVFTHLSEAASLAALRALRRHVHERSLLVITVRPIEYWDLARYIPPRTAEHLKRAHRSNGLAFFPYSDGGGGNPTNETYGDASIAFDWFASKCPEWNVRQIDRSLSDRLQTYVFLTPA